jgi:hypothetical protein
MNTNDGVCLHINYSTGTFSLYKFWEYIPESGPHNILMEKEAGLVNLKISENEGHVQSTEETQRVHKC